VSALSTALLSDATDGVGLLPPAIAARTPGERVAGPAYTVAFRAGDNLALHVAVAHAPRGSVLVAGCGGAGDRGVFGALLATAARRAGLLGLVTDGCVRDVAELRELPFPVFSAGVSPRRASKADPGRHEVAVRLGTVTVRPGDLVCADDDGVIAVERRQVEDVLSAAERIRVAEAEALDRVNHGETTLAALGLDHAAGSTESA
jgi:4-hydroxy-4-methyl-2-oxoglutarate aldolase